MAVHAAACANLYIHEIAMHVEHNVDDFRPGILSENTRRSLDLVTSAHVRALSTILEASQRVLETYVSLDLDLARSLPNMYIVWNTYAMVVLIKLHWVVHAPDSKFGSIFFPDLKASHYIDAMLVKLAQVSEGGQGPCAEAFGFVYQKLKMWHMHRAGQFADDDKDADTMDQRRQQATNILSSDTADIFRSTKDSTISNMDAERQQREASTNLAIVPPQFPLERQSLASNLNSAYDAASYGNTNWDQFNFSAEELNVFDVYMNNASGWMGYLL